MKLLMKGLRRASRMGRDVGQVGQMRRVRRVGQVGRVRVRAARAIVEQVIRVSCTGDCGTGGV